MYIQIHKLCSFAKIMYDHVNVINQRLDLVIQRCNLISQRLDSVSQRIDTNYLMSDGFKTVQEIREVGVDIETFSSNLLTKIQNARKIH
jgi:hypothetical protein